MSYKTLFLPSFLNDKTRRSNPIRNRKWKPIFLVVVFVILAVVTVECAGDDFNI